MWTPDRELGQFEDLVASITNFHSEDTGFMVLDGDVFDVPIRKDIVPWVVRGQLAKTQQLLVFETWNSVATRQKTLRNTLARWMIQRKVLLVDGRNIDKIIKLATQNLHYVNGLDVDNILQYDTLVMTQAAINIIVMGMHTRNNH